MVFCERPLRDITPNTRGLVLAWLGQVVESGGIVVTRGEPLREALLMPGTARSTEEATDASSKPRPTTATKRPSTADVRRTNVFKVPVKSGDTTLLFDPRELDFVESVNRANFVSVRGELYPVQMTLDELEAKLSRYGFFRCHRSYIVNVQKVVKVERFTRNSFNLTLADAARTSIPLAKGRADEMRERYGWR